MTVRVTDTEVETFFAGGNTFRVLDDGTSTGEAGRSGSTKPVGAPAECCVDDPWCGRALAVVGSCGSTRSARARLPVSPRIR